MPQDEKSIIRSILDPTIILDEISFDDVEENSHPEFRSRGTKLQKQIGDVFPLIKVNTYLISQSELIRLKIDCTSFLPEITVTFVLAKHSTFLSRDFPKDGDRINVFIRGRSDLFKPIRNDYLITNVSTSKGLTNDGDGMRITLSGILYIPRFYDEVIFAERGTSFEVLQKIAKNLGLGFATNEVATNDQQYWLSTNNTYQDFINEVTYAAWKDENSFFTSFIDVYYHLNFVNVNNQFSNSTAIDEALLDVLFTHDDMEDEEIATTNTKKVFSNLQSLRGTNMFIKNYKLINNSSEIAKRYGYRIYVEFFEHNSLKPWSIFTEPLILEGAEKDKILLKGKPGENTYRSQIKRRWAGLQYSLPEHNVHEKFLYARVHNLMNNLELEKLQVQIDVPRANFNIYRGERIPCVFISSGDPLKTPFLQHEDETQGENAEILKSPGAPVIDKFYSGYYMIKGMIFSYEANTIEGNAVFTESVVLTRREWPTP